MAMGIGSWSTMEGAAGLRSLIIINKHYYTSLQHWCKFVFPLCDVYPIRRQRFDTVEIGTDYNTLYNSKL